jgi:mRNA interferase MazF
MTERPFVAGDVLIVDLDPIKGSEQSGIRPAWVISSAVMHEVSKRIVVCPITPNLSPWPTKVRIPDGHKTIGMVLAEPSQIAGSPAACIAEHRNLAA